MSSNCRDWYLDYDTKQDCLENKKIVNIPVDIGEPTTAIATTKTSTTTRTTTGSTTTGSTTSMTVTITVEATHEQVDFGGTEYEDYEGGGDYEDGEIVREIEDVTMASQALTSEPETILKAEVKARVGVDGKVLTAVLSLELVGGAVMSYCIYKCMTKVGQWLTNGTGRTDNLEQSNVPLHENQAPNPEETIRPAELDDESGDYRTAFLDSTRIDQTQVTNLTSLSPIGKPQMNRTQSYFDVSAAPGPSGLAKSTSEPILLDLDQNFDDSVADLDASQLLSQPVPPSAGSIIEAATQANNVTTANEATTDNEATTANDATTANEATTASKAATPKKVTFAKDTAPAEEASDVDQAARRYPKRKRTSPKRFGF